MLLNGDVNLFLLTVGSFSQLLLVSALKRKPPVLQYLVNHQMKATVLKHTLFFSVFNVGLGWIQKFYLSVS